VKPGAGGSAWGTLCQEVHQSSGAAHDAWKLTTWTKAAPCAWGERRARRSRRPAPADSQGEPLGRPARAPGLPRRAEALGVQDLQRHEGAVAGRLRAAARRGVHHLRGRRGVRRRRRGRRPGSERRGARAGVRRGAPRTVSPSVTSTAPLAWRPTSPVSSVSCARPPRRESQRAAAKYRRRRRALCRPGSRSARPQAHLPAAHVYRNPVRHQLQHAAAALLRRARAAAPPGRPRAAPPGAARRLCRPRLAGRALAVAAGLVPRCRGAAGACLVRRCGRPGRSGPRAMLQQGGHRAVRQARRKRRLLVTVMQAWMSHRASEGWPPWTLSGSGQSYSYFSLSSSGPKTPEGSYSALVGLSKLPTSEPCCAPRTSVLGRVST